MVWASFRVRIMPRISTIWTGSRSWVGSSRIRSSGSWTIAWATPTRWRYPWDRWRAGTSWTSVTRVYSSTSGTRRATASADMPLIRPTKAK